MLSFLIFICFSNNVFSKTVAVRLEGKTPKNVDFQKKSWENENIMRLERLYNLLVPIISPLNWLNKKSIFNTKGATNA